MHDQCQDMMLYNDDMQQQYPICPTSEPLQMSQAFTTDAPQDLGLKFPYLQPYVDMPIMKFVENDDLPATQIIWARPFFEGCLRLQDGQSIDSFTCDTAGRLGTESINGGPEIGLEHQIG
jgi:hypothetical protein